MPQRVKPAEQGIVLDALSAGYVKEREELQACKPGGLSR